MSIKLNLKVLKWAFVIGLILVVILLMINITKTRECIANPFTYGAKSIENSQTGGVSCVCSFDSPNYAPFYFNKENVSTVFYDINPQ